MFKYIIGCNYEKGIYMMHRVQTLKDWTSEEARATYAHLREEHGSGPIICLEDNDGVWKSPTVEAKKRELEIKIELEKERAKKKLEDKLKKLFD